MDLTYFKRYRMEIDLAGCNVEPAPIPDGYRYLPWSPATAGGLCRGQVSELSRRDRRQRVFPCLGEFDGLPPADDGDRPKNRASCPRPPGCLPTCPPGRQQAKYCGTIQGIRDHAGLGGHPEPGGSCPNTATPAWEPRLLFKRPARVSAGRASRGFYLEVTAQNEGAIRLYRRLGFSSRSRTVYKAVESVYS